MSIVYTFPADWVVEGFLDTWLYSTFQNSWGVPVCSDIGEGALSHPSQPAPLCLAWETDPTKISWQYQVLGKFSLPLKYDYYIVFILTYRAFINKSDHQVMTHTIAHYDLLTNAMPRYICGLIMPLLVWLNQWMEFNSSILTGKFKSTSGQKVSSRYSQWHFLFQHKLHSSWCY